MNTILHNRAQAFLHNLDRLSATGQHDAFINEVLESNGFFIAPKHDQSHLWELSLHGINATGANEEEAIANWKRLAIKAMPDDQMEDDGFVTVHPPLYQIAGAAA
jgi:hypothetical protein